MLVAQAQVGLPKPCFTTSVSSNQNHMIIVISPAKTLDFEPQNYTKKHTMPDFLADSKQLIDKLSKMSKTQVGKLMGISEKLADLNVQRYREWETPFSTENAKQAMLAFKGDVYQGFDCPDWKAADFTFAQQHLRILSGLYGLLRPLDLIQPYRLEMGTKLKTKRGKNLCDFWGDAITDAIDDAIKVSRSKAFVNLASNEYIESVKGDLLQAPMITPVFKDEKNGKYKIISFFAKKARGMMSDFIVRNRITNPADLQGFDMDGYYFSQDASSDEKLVFLRGEL
jgi:cytoplasmic iron level regulating protein YaaA (DUF328/UPF0246 family)